MKRTFEIKLLVENDFDSFAQAKEDTRKYLTEEVSPDNLTVKHILDTRTPPKNNAIHLFCKLLADTLNEHGLEVRVVLSEEVEHPWTTVLVKELIWRPIQQSYLGKTSTTELDKVKEINNIVDVINRFIGERWSLYVPFPSIEYQNTAQSLLMGQKNAK